MHRKVGCLLGGQEELVPAEGIMHRPAWPPSSASAANARLPLAQQRFDGGRTY
jgi:hypothetical protein